MATLAIASGCLLGYSKTQAGFLVCVAACLALAVLVRWPTAFMLCALILFQELSAASTYGVTSSALQTFGSQFYYTLLGPLPLIEVVAFVGMLAALFHQSRQGTGIYAPRVRRQIKLAVSVMGLCILVIVVLTVLQGGSALSALGQYCRPLILASCGLLIASSTPYQPGGWKSAVNAGAVSMGLVAFGGLLLLVTGRAAGFIGGSLSIFYDSALPALASAVLLALLMTGKWKSWVTPAPTIIILLSGRRSVWIAFIITLIIILILCPGRIKSARQLAIFASLIFILSAFLFPSVMNDVGARIVASISTAQGSGDELSSLQHMQDLRLGLGYVLEAPALGYGPKHDALPGLANQSALYVHNEYMYDWLRFGFLGFISFFVPACYALILGLRRIRHSSGVVAISAVFVVIAPICAMTAPFLNAQRWSSLLGIAVGILLTVPDNFLEAVKVSPSAAGEKFGGEKFADARASNWS